MEHEHIHTGVLLYCTVVQILVLQFDATCVGHVKIQLKTDRSRTEHKS